MKLFLETSVLLAACGWAQGSSQSAKIETMKRALIASDIFAAAPGVAVTVEEVQKVHAKSVNQ